MSDVTPTGGQLCVRGILQQMLRGLAQGTALVLDHGAFDGTRLKSVTLTLEPADGGDHQIKTAGVRVVEQVKIRTNGAAWTTGDIAGEVLHDLVRAVSATALPTRYRFATDGLLNCAPLLALSERLRGRPVPASPAAALDHKNKRAFNYGGWKSERDFFKALAKRAGCAKNLAALWEVLANLEIEGGLTDDKLIQQIDAFLFDIVDYQEQVPAKRAHLIMVMLDLAAKGGTITIEDLLAETELPIERTLHYAKLPTVVRATLQQDLALLGYDAERDVRDSPRAVGKGITLFAGDSGYGKSWRVGALLHNLDRDGHLAVLVSNANSIEAVQKKVTDVVWHSSFDADLGLPGLKRRLGHRFVDSDDAWLTVGVDDIQDRALLADLRAANWAQYGVRVVATVPTQLANEVAVAPLPPAIAPVERFSLPQVRKYLRHYKRPWEGLPGDVIELLQVPIFADLYRRIDGDAWVPRDEYALVDRFWHHTTFATKGMADHQDDALALEQLARTLLAPTGAYPWTVAAAVDVGLDQTARARLVKSGLLRQGLDGIVVIHDRVLNWLVARTIAVDLTAGKMTTADALAAVQRVDQPDAVAPGLAYRLGYVLLDFLWLAARMCSADQVAAFLEGWLQMPEHRMNQERFIEEHLPGLGAPILGTLAIVARQPGEDRRINGIHAAKAIAVVGKTEPKAARDTAIPLLATGATDESVRAGLLAGADLPLGEAIDRLWAIHHERREASGAAKTDDPHVRHGLFDRAQTSAKALVSAARTRPDWIAKNLALTNDGLAAELLLELLLELDDGDGRGIWTHHKGAFLSRIAAGKSIVPRAIMQFGDGGEIARLEAHTDGADWLEPQKRFDALIRVAPDRVAGLIGTLSQDLVGWRSWFSVGRLIRNGGDTVRPALLARHAGGWEGMADLAHTYWHDRLAIDQASFIAMIAALEERLKECAGKHWQPTRERFLVQFLAEATRPDLLAILESYRGSEFERLLCDVATGGEGRKSLCVDTDADHIERLLLAIGGVRFTEMVAHGVARDRVFARRDGYDAAVHVPRGAIAPQLSAAAFSEDRHQQEDYALTVALAVHGCDDALYQVVMDTQAAYNDAIDVRTKEGGWPPAVEKRMRVDLASADSATRIGATCALAMAPPHDATDLLVATLARCPDDDPSALTVVRIAEYLDRYSPAMLPQLERMLALTDEQPRSTVLPYLAEHGDADARAVARMALSCWSSGQYDRSALRAAFALSEDEPNGGQASERLTQFLDGFHGSVSVGLVACRLHDNKMLSDDALIDLAYSAPRISSDCVFRLNERVRTFDPAEALAIAQRRFCTAASAGGARQILELGGADGIDWLIEAYLRDDRHEVKWLIARALRRHAERDELMPRVTQLVGRNSAVGRIAAAELLGWIPDTRAAALLATLAQDPNVDVSDAALDGEARTEAERWGKVLIGELASADHYGRWSRIAALVDMVDPYLLELDDDGLQIGEVVDGMDEIVAIWIEKALVKSKTALTKQAERLHQKK